jgi:serine/threonine protein kinase
MSSNQCPECQKPIPLDSPAGLCPECLLAQGLTGSPSTGPTFAATTPQPGRIFAPDAQTIARYFPQLEVLELVGQGGMGAVYKARQAKLDRLVAVKIIRAECCDDPAFAERFTREARTLARLSHPGIVAVHDFGELPMPTSSVSTAECKPQTLFYFIMEYVDGANLRQLMQSGRLSPEMAMSIIPQVCEALQYAHEEGVVHRDIKPENILLDNRGRVRLADFGLAKLGTRSGMDWTLTGTHQIMGTPQYMAPEQMSGSRNVDHRSDIYSLGVVFYEMLTGTIPVGHFALPSQKSAVDRRLDDVVLKAMANEPERRFQAAHELRNSVENLIAAAKSGSKPPVGDPESVRAGVSTILDREVAGAWHLLAGGRQPAHAERPAFPWLIMLALCLVGAFSLLLPWFRYEIPNDNMAREEQNFLKDADALNSTISADSIRKQMADEDLPTDQIAVGSSLLPAAGAVNGKDLRTGLAAGTMFVSVAVLLLLIPESARTWALTPTLFLIVSVFAMLMTLQSSFEAPRMLRNQTVPSARGADARIHLDTQFAKRVQDSLFSYQLCVQQPPEPSEPRDGALRTVKTFAEPGYYLPLLCSGLLIVLNLAAVRRAVFDTTDDEAAGNHTDSIVLNRSDLDPSNLQANIFPDVCMVCGQDAAVRVTRKIEFQPKWAGALTFAGLVLGGIPGIIIAMATTEEIDITCPVCTQHRNHWSRLTHFASIGWIIPLLSGGLGYLTGYLPSTWDPTMDRGASVIGLVIGLLAGIALYVIPIVVLNLRQVKCNLQDDNRVVFHRLSPGFASAVRRNLQKR